MILAENAGVYVIIGGQCCTFPLNNTAPDGTITKALQVLTTLANELAQNWEQMTFHQLNGTMVWKMEGSNGLHTDISYHCGRRNDLGLLCHTPCKWISLETNRNGPYQTNCSILSK
jgi:hypothetical protein